MTVPTIDRQGVPKREFASSHATAQRTSTLSSDELSFGQLVAILRPQWRIILAAAISLGVLLGGSRLLSRRNYMATASFAPEGSQNTGMQLPGLAAQLGLSGLVGGGSQSLDFYAMLVRSQQILETAVDTTVTLNVDGGTEQRSLIDVLGPKGGTPQERRRRAADRLRGVLGVSPNKLTGTVAISLRAETPEVAEALARRILTLVEQFDMQKRQSRAAAERRFVEDQLAQANAELRAAEAATQRFLEQNREFNNSPVLRLRYEPLQRRIASQQNVVMTLTQAFQQARINEVRNTPVITILDRPEGSARPSSRHVVQFGLFGLVAGTLMASLIVLVQAFRRERSYEAAT